MEVHLKTNDQLNSCSDERTIATKILIFQSAMFQSQFQHIIVNGHLCLDFLSCHCHSFYVLIKSW